MKDKMRAIHTNSTIPYVSYLGRYRSEDQYHVEDFEILTTVLSALNWRKHNGSIKMYTDTLGARYYETIGLSFLWDDGIDTNVLDSQTRNINHNVFWTFGRIAALKHESAPVVALDTDLVVWSEISKAVYSDLMMLHSEPLFLDVYLPKSELYAPSDFSWPELNWETSPHCASFIYFGNNEIKNYFCDFANNFMTNNPIKKEVVESMPTHDVFVAQRLLPMCADKLGIKCGDLLRWKFGSHEKETKLDGSVNDLITHIWAYKKIMKDNFSKREKFCQKAISRIIADFPEVEPTLRKINSLKSYFNETKHWGGLSDIKEEPKCVAPFVSIALWATGQYQMCCEDKHFDGTKRINDVESIAELVNSEKFIATRKLFIKGQIPNGCEFCLNESKYQPMINGMYQRYKWNDVSQHYNHVTGKVDQTRYLLVALSNICNYSCRMCFDALSTKLNGDRVRIFGTDRVGYKENDIDKVIAFIKQNPLDLITFHGGNSLCEPRFLEVLSSIKSGTNIEVITNGSTLTIGGENVLSHLSRFNSVRFNISLDGTKQTTEYIRIHSKFENVLKHYEQVRKLPNSTVNIHNTITNLNLFDLPNYYKMVLFGEFSEADSIYSYVTTSPDIYCVGNLHPLLRKKADRMLSVFLEELENIDCQFQEKLQLVKIFVNNTKRRIYSTEFNQLKYDEFLNVTRKIDEYYGFDGSTAGWDKATNS